MTTEPLDPCPPRLFAMLAGAPDALVAVVDGAIVDNLPVVLDRAGLAHRPLYIDRGDGSRSWNMVSPRVVDIAASPDRAAMVERLVRAIAPARAVYWMSPQGGDAIFAHLRGLNRVVFDKPGDRGGTTVFRHADPDVLAQVVPALDPRAFARFIGAAHRVAFAVGPEWSEGGRVMVVERTADLPRPRTGFLVIDAATVGRIEARRADAIWRSVRQSLVERSAGRRRAFSDAEVDAAVARSRAFSERYGIRTEGARSDWAFLDLLSDGRPCRSPNAHALLTSPGDPDDAVALFYDSLRRRLARADASKCG